MQIEPLSKSIGYTPKGRDSAETKAALHPQEADLLTDSTGVKFRNRCLLSPLIVSLSLFLHFFLFFQVFSVLESTYQHDSLRYLLDYFVPAKHLLHKLQQHACVSSFFLDENTHARTHTDTHAHTDTCVLI